ncbi:flagellar assembly peptidoglycan hydrolase FlgJ [Aliiglaciecola sp. LCG003]|uniref:flagellar assembly peptidoglycan hydrolase FlgJ n=1 Tax=Aliiglaciecola sp. LCG003 TaxID=3053655 RepID=UPI0025731A9B|nr:flagellar assembly peptidoglycan hydrolase FlgJ [Aliiglaciecola sp. LCG003]WJG10555.1 flagellar assembly peptidoglycan hydrolase FlgJ [Aliiglaciecola sp. LCG003]
MDLNNHINSQIDMSRNVNDIKGIDQLRQAALSGDKGALDEAAKQFEAIFVQMMLKSMRKAQDALADQDSPFNSQQVKFYRDMHDQQLAVDLSTRGNIGIADIIVQQLSPEQSGLMPASAIRQNANLAGMVRQASEPHSIRSQQSSNDTPDTALNTIQPATKKAAFSSPSDFVAALMPHAEAFANKLGVDAKALLAQAAVETGWGRFMIHGSEGQNSHNLFGIKADKRWQGDSAAINTVEFEDGVAKQKKAAFRSYDSFTDALQDYVAFVKDNPRYQQAMQKASDPKAYFDALQDAGYATDPQYADKIMSVLNSDTFKMALSFGQGE